MRLVFFGTPSWAVPSMNALIAAGLDVRAVVTAPDAAVGRSRELKPTAVKMAAQALGIAPILQFDSLRGAPPRDAILALRPDALVVVAYGRILPGRLLDAPRFGAINMHFSLLPRHRGASPVQHTILLGDALAGVSTMQMDRGLDTGPILLTRALPLPERITATELGAQLAEVGAGLLVETLVGLERGTITPRPQDETAATLAPPLTREMGRVDWTATAEAIARRVRAFSDWPPVVAQAGARSWRLIHVSPAPRSTTVSESASLAALPGTILARHGDSLEIAAGEGTRLHVHRWLPAGGREISGAAALAGRLVGLGTVLA